jgi:NAD(P)-dependent dehydrogenase (short-subunit alcohol dehydrogenase family)
VSDIDLSGELVLISGGEGALGQYVCARLAGCGATVVSVDVAHGENGRTGEAPEDVWPFQADISVSAEVEELLDTVRGRFGRHPTTVCCHAGVVAAHPVLDYPLDAFDDLFRVNVRGAFVLAQAAARRWRDAGVAGHLIFTSSWVQDYPWPEIAPYCASKAALYSLMRSFAKELAPFGIRANAVLPGIVSAGMARRQWDEDPEYRRRAQGAIALGELQDPSSVADAFAFLCSPMASYMTGSPFLVDGGCALGPLNRQWE